MALETKTFKLICVKTKRSGWQVVVMEWVNPKKYLLPSSKVMVKWMCLRKKLAVKGIRTPSPPFLSPCPQQK